MAEQVDEKIGRLLRAHAPPERDALFRIRLIERRERARYRRSQLKLLVAALLITALTATVTLLHPKMFSADLLSAVLSVLFVLALFAAGARAMHGLRQALRWLRGVQHPRR